jgi:HPt (histidine-containing phosphotransfer) domain-containing protein
LKSQVPDPSQLAEILKSKAMLLIQREREVFALRLGREQMRGWLEAFHGLSVKARPDAGMSICADWTRAMIEERHFQTAAAFRYDGVLGALSLIHGQSHAALPEKITLDEDGRRVLREHSKGLFDRSKEPDRIALARSLGLQRFLWFLLPGGDHPEILLVAGVAAGIGGARGAISEDDLLYFAMLGRHMAVLLNNGSLIAALVSAKRNLQELFDHMRQAIVAFDASGTVRGISSRQAKVIFGHEDLEGRPVRELLYPQAPSYDIDAASFDEWVDLALGVPVEEWASCEPYAPREVVITSREGATIPLELEFQPLVRNGRVTQLMLLATDVTLARKLQDAIQTHESDRSRRVATMRRLIAGGTQVFLSFVDTARMRIARCEAILRDRPGALLIEHIDELFRLVHTVRGEARAFDLLDLEAITKQLEDALDEQRNAARGMLEVPTATVSVKLEAGLELARAALDQGCDVLVAASPAGTAVFDLATVQRSALRELVELTRDRADPVGRLVARLTAVPFGLTAAGVVESASAWAALEGNLVTLHVSPRELMIPERLARVLPGVLTHLVRNAIAHGIEPPQERLAASKQGQGSIRIVAEETARGVTVTVEDDGRGLDVARILARVEGTEDRNADVTDLVFLPGVTTRETRDALAGRGVGLDAVRKDLAEIHYDVSVHFAKGQWTRVAIVPTEVGEGESREGAS